MQRANFCFRLQVSSEGLKPTTLMARSCMSSRPVVSRRQNTFFT